MNYANIKNYDIANGTGIRVSLFVSGCPHHCKGCFNPETWDYAYGKEYTEAIENMIIELLKPDYIAGLTLLGGEPFAPANQPALLKLLKKIRQVYGDRKNIWSYTGYVYPMDMVQGGRAYTDSTRQMLEQLDVLVDGPFVEHLKDISLKFRGSSNQRLIDIKNTLKQNEIILLNF